MSDSPNGSNRFSGRTLIGALAIAATASAVTWAAARQEGPGGPGRGPALSGFGLYMALDTDGQEGLSPAEIDKAGDVLRGLDRNGDRRLTADELPAGRGGRGGPGRGPGGFPGRGGFEGGREGFGRGERGEGPGGEAPQISADDLVTMLMAFDANKDGTLTREEAPERLQSLFDRADSNKDGKLTAAEIKASAQAQEQQAQQNMRGRGRGEGEGRGDGEGRFGRGGPFGGPDALITALDTNKDGALSFDELNNVSAALRRLDRNGDGVVTIDEIIGGGRGRG